MRYVAVALAALLAVCAGSAWAANSVVQCVTGAWSSGTTWTATLTASNGNLLVGSHHFLASDNANEITASSDTANAYLVVNTDQRVVGGLNNRLTIFYAKSITGGALTFTTTAASTNINRAFTCLCEVSGADTSAPLDQNAMAHQTTPGTGADAVTSGNVTTTTNGQFIYGATRKDTATAGFTAGTNESFTKFSGTANPYDLGACERAIQTSAGATAAKFTQDADSDISTGVATFKAAGGAAAASPRRGRVF